MFNTIIILGPTASGKTDISIKPYIIGKLLQACISAFYTFIFLNTFSFFNFDL